MKKGPKASIKTLHSAWECILPGFLHAASASLLFLTAVMFLRDFSLSPHAKLWLVEPNDPCVSNERSCARSRVQFAQAGEKLHLVQLGASVAPLR